MKKWWSLIVGIVLIIASVCTLAINNKPVVSSGIISERNLQSVNDAADALELFFDTGASSKYQSATIHIYSNIDDPRNYRELSVYISGNERYERVAGSVYVKEEAGVLSFDVERYSNGVDVYYKFNKYVLYGDFPRFIDKDLQGIWMSDPSKISSFVFDAAGDIFGIEYLQSIKDYLKNSKEDNFVKNKGIYELSEEGLKKCIAYISGTNIENMSNKILQLSGGRFSVNLKDSKKAEISFSVDQLSVDEFHKDKNGLWVHKIYEAIEKQCINIAVENVNNTVIYFDGLNFDDQAK